MLFQELIERLNSFWSKHGVLIAQPYGVEVAAGTANPHTIFRVLGPEPYNVAYVEPSRRPADGMYGKNPNRLQHYYQYQVILKPAPRFNTQLYIEMLKHIGIDPTKHDLRFVEDNWKSPSLAAWGVGWEVWLDGMEITQYTYFQQVAGIDLEVPALEITLGLERLAMYLQNVEHYKDIKWTKEVTYGDVFKDHERLQSQYNFEIADTSRIRRLIQLHTEEAELALDHNNYWAAYDHLLKISHYFNILDARGVITYNQRVEYFKIMRELVSRIARLYLKDRESQSYPLLHKVNTVDFVPPLISLKDLKAPTADEPTPRKEQDAETVVLELGFEELPVSYLKKLEAVYTAKFIEDFFKRAGFNAINSIQRIITPTRIGFIARGLQKHLKLTSKVTGPSKDIALTPQGKPTKALLGFLDKHNLSIDQIKWEKRGDIQVATATIHKELNLEDVLQEFVNKLLTLVQTSHNRWDNNPKHAFIRPLRWIVAIINNSPLNIEALGVSSGYKQYTLTPRYLDPARVEIDSAPSYLEFLHQTGVHPEPSDRSKLIKTALKDAYSDSLSYIVQENVFLTESPLTQVLTLPPKYYELPFEVIDAILRVNQRFLVFKEGDVIKYAIVVNQHPGISRTLLNSILQGYNKVTTARLEDGLSYMHRDLKKDIKDYREDLKDISFSQKGGSWFEKVHRVEQLVTKITTIAGLNIPHHVKTVLDLIKNDKATYLGQEYPELQDLITYYYAQKQGYSKEVLDLLKQISTTTPTDIWAYTINLVDIIDTILVLSLEVDLTKIGSKDQFQIRKQIYTLVNMLLNPPRTTPQILRDIKIVIETILHEYESIFSKDTLKQIAQNSEKLQQLILERATTVLSKQYDKPLVRGVLHAQWGDIYQASVILQDLANLSPQDRELILSLLKRVFNILKKADIAEPNLNIDESLFETKSEKQLYEIIKTLESTALTVTKLPKLARVLEKFFEENMVMHHNQDIKRNRLALLSILQKHLQKLIDIQNVWGK